ncbi:MAG: VWA domain-containing protein [Bacteroidales bacterium]|nr:VWA domain-containing protein [Bacteroidales bacterium]
MKQNYNNESLALLGHGKWKSALGHTLLIIGMVLMSLGAYAQTPSTDIPAGLKMKKTWVADDPLTNTSGKVVLETYVTGSEITTTSSVPNDIVIIVDQSGSMADNMSSGTTRLQALKDAVETFCTKVKNDAVQNHVDHKIAIVGFASGYTGYQNYGNTGSIWNPHYEYYNPRWNWENTELLSTQNEVAYGAATSGACAINTQNYQDALVSVNNNGNVNNRLTTAITRMAASGGTCMQYGLEMAYGVLSNRLVTTYQAPDGTTHPRGQIVIFFTDGYPGLFFPTTNNVTAGNGADGRFAQGYGDNDYYEFNATPRYVNYNELWSAANIADAAVAQANNLKSNGATIFAVGIFDGATPTAAYQTNQYNATISDQDYHYWQPSQSGINGDPAANGLMHMISSNYDNKPGCIVGMASNWQDETTNTNNTANRFVEHTYTVDGEEKTWTPKYFDASNPDDLNAVFSSIADQSGAEPIAMSAATVVQDEVSASFTLPVGASINDIEIYAVKCSGGVVNQQLEATDYYFQTTGGDEFGTKTTYDGTTIQYLTLNANGVVVEGNNLPENRLDPKGPDGTANTDDDLVVFTTNTDGNQQISLTGFNFANMFCGPIIRNHQVTGWQGRKLVIKIPIVVADGVWGDGVATNGPMSFVLPDGGTVSYAFECPITNVMGSVWTEVVTAKPDVNYDPMNIDSPEDLAWFISEVNGRIGYNQNNTIPSNPTLNGRLTADIDMSAHNWVPIGCGFQVEVGDDGKTQYVIGNDGKRVPMRYEGTFDGNGHVITGLKNNASKFYKRAEGQTEGGVVVFPGMFSDVKGTVKNVFVLDADFRGKHHDANFVHHGIIADTLEAGGNIFNCEAAGRITCNNDDTDDDAKLIYGGLVGLNAGTIHSTMAMAELTAYTMGGMIGENRGSFSNGFTNGVYNYLDNGITGKNAGGIAGINTGTIDNCYVRFERYNTNLDKMGDGFGMIYGSNTGTNNVTNCYTPELYTYTRPSATQAPVQVQTNSTVPNQGAMNPYTITVSPTYFNYFTNDNMTKGSWSTTGDPIYQNGKSLLAELNANKGSGASWKRTTAGNYDYAHGSGDINDDYPVLAFEKFAEGDDAPLVTCLGSADGIRIDYATSLNDMLHRHNNGNLNENTTLTGNKYKPTNHEAIYKGAINLYVNDEVTAPTTGGSKEGVADNCTAQGVVVYIDENISLLQDKTSIIEAYTGQTVKSFVKSDSKERWHYVSSSLTNSQFGWTYSGDGQHNWNENPCGFTLAQTDEDRALFPIDLISYKRVDFYCFYEPQYHWINFKRNKNSHFHMDQWNAGIPIQYDNESAFVKGKGYLMSIESDYHYQYGKRNAQFLQNRGTLTNGAFTILVTYTPTNDLDGYKTGLEGYNLLGNPYQSYLDFTTFAWENKGLWNEKAEDMTFAVYDPKTDSYVQGMAGAQPSKGAFAATGDINMHQGFLIRVSKGGDAKFNNNMRSNTPADDTHFRGEQPTYPLINFILTDNNGTTDIAVLELNRPENSGALKLRAGNPNGRIYFRHDNTNMAIFFRDNAEGHQSLNFAAEEDGNFTLSWNTANADFRTLTLVDNITGIKTDMLTHDHYTFEGRVDDYNTRFKIVFGEMDNNEEEPVLEHFAFFDHGNLIVNGAGHFEVVDVLGRVVYATELTDTQNTVSLPSNVRGVCMLCFTRNNETKVQKMVIQ